MAADCWALSVYDKSMVHKVTYSWTSDSITLDGQGSVSPTLANIQDIEWEVTPNENSLWATWMGDSNGSILDIDAQDRIVIWTKGYRSGETTTTYYPRGRFYCSIPANANHIDGEAHQYRAIGIADLLKTTDTGENHQIDEGQDLASGVADTIISNLPDGLPAGISHTTFSDIGVSNTGKINPDSADLYQNLDAIATLCAIGGLSVVWGVKPDGTLFLEQASTTVMSVNERGAGTTVTWLEPQADEIVSAIRWIIADGTMTQKNYSTDGVSLSTPDVLTHLSDSGITTYGKRVKPMTLPQGVSGFKDIIDNYNIGPGSLIASYVGSTADGTPTLNRMDDDDPTSYSVIEEGNSGITPGFITLTAQIANDATADGVVAIRLNMKEDSSGSSISRSYGALEMQPETTTEYVHYLKGSQLPGGIPDATQGTIEIDKWFIWGDRGRNTGVTLVNGGQVEMQLFINDDGARMAIESFRVFGIDTESLDALAEAHYKFPQENAFKSSHNRQIAPGGLATVMKSDGTTISDLPVEAIGYRISGAGGEHTFVTVGPRLPPEVAEEFNRRDRIVNSSSLTAARAGMTQR